MDTVVSERVPLKQGLKHCLCAILPSVYVSFRESSIKTRIETLKRGSYRRQMPDVSERVPLKQGLKHNEDDYVRVAVVVVSERVPLKQGLKLCTCLCCR
jgi:hypothetical protein